MTEKLDGSSATYFVKNGEFGVCSRNLELLEDDENSFWKVAKDLQIESKMRQTGKNMALQGELVGEGIQGNKLKLKGQTVKFFNAFDIDKFEFLNFEDFEKLLNDLDLQIVPVIDREYLLENDIDAIVKKSIIKSKICPDAYVEGIVIRPYTEKIDTLLSDNSSNSRVSFKAINPEFLLKATKAMKEASGNAYPTLNQHGETDAAVMTCGMPNYICIIMPMNVRDKTGSLDSYKGIELPK